MNFQSLKEELAKTQLPDSVQLTPQELITDTKKFVANHISILENNRGKRMFLPYYNRLLKLYQLCKQSTTQ